MIHFMCLSNAAKNPRPYGAFDAMIFFATFYIYIYIYILFFIQYSVVM